MSGVHRPHYHEKQPYVVAVDRRCRMGDADRAVVFRREGKNYMQLNFESDGVWTTTIRGEEVVVPDLQNTLEFTLPSPCGEHTFEESPIVKETKRKDEETETDDD
jgi:hypothetical protein